jgi:hypothetical protein
MPEPKDTLLYEKAKNIVYSQYEKPSAYRSGALVKKYKQLYTEKYGNNDAYEGKKTLTGLTRWYKEDWKDINPYKTISSYPVYRPTKRITIETPKTANEISEKRLKEQSILKQLVKGMKNLPKF